MRYLTIFFVLAAVSCAPQMKYLGDTYDAKTGDIDVFYDIGDIDKDFKVMGILTADTESSLNKSSDHVKNLMIEKAASKGADAILFMNIYGTGGEDGDSLVESKLIKYK